MMKLELVVHPSLGSDVAKELTKLGFPATSVEKRSITVTSVVVFCVGANAVMELCKNIFKALKFAKEKGPQIAISVSSTLRRPDGREIEITSETDEDSVRKFLLGQD